MSTATYLTAARGYDALDSPAEGGNMEFASHRIKWDREKTARLWEYYAASPAYRSMYFGFINGRYVARFIEKRIGLRRFRNILDFGCGQGDLIAACMPYLKAPQRIAGLDFSESSVANVNRRFYGGKAFGGAVAVSRLPSDMPSGVYDLILCTEVVEHLTDEELTSTLTELRRLLAPNGVLFITTPNDENYAANEALCPDCGCVFHRWQHLRTWTADSIAQRMAAAGFTGRALEVALANRLRRMLSVIRPSERKNLVYVGRQSHL